MSKADRAEELFRMGYNCSQSVYAAFAEELGISIEKMPLERKSFMHLCGNCVALLKNRKEV